MSVNTAVGFVARPVNGALVQIFNAGTSTPSTTTFSDSACTVLATSVNADVNGNYTFYVNPVNKFKIVISGVGVTTLTLDNVNVPPSVGNFNPSSGTTNTIPKFTNGAAAVLGNSSVTDNGTTVTTTEAFAAPSVAINGATALTSTTGASAVAVVANADIGSTGLVIAVHGPGFHQQTFTGSGTFTIPSGISQVKVTVVAGGGAGGGGTAAATPGDGGGSGGTGIKYLSGLTPGNTLTVTVGNGGTGVSGLAGNNGASSSVSSGTQTITTITTNGGSGGVLASQGPGAGGAAGTGGDFNFGGTAGGVGTPANTTSGAGGPSIFSGGGTQVVGNNTGGAGSAPGAGGAGGGGTAGNTTGGAGANGVVIFEWVN